jgi:hypothetical protein
MMEHHVIDVSEWRDVLPGEGVAPSGPISLQVLVNTAKYEALQADHAVEDAKRLVVEAIALCRAANGHIAQANELIEAAAKLSGHTNCIQFEPYGPERILIKEVEVHTRAAEAATKEND